MLVLVVASAGELASAQPNAKAREGHFLRALRAENAHGALKLA
jgi:hypothetical protein